MPLFFIPLPKNSNNRYDVHPTKDKDQVNMPKEETTEEKLQIMDRKLKEFSIALECVQDEYQRLLKDLDLTHEQAKAHIENPHHFESHVWEKLQEEKKKLDEKLDLELKNTPQILKTKKTTKERANIQQHWMFVR